MIYNLARLFIFLPPLFLITGCNQNHEVINQTNIDQSTENEENPKTSAEPSTTKPLQGTVNGEPFQLDEASFQSGVDTLALKQGEEFSPELGVILFLFLEDSSQPPVGRQIKTNCQEGEMASGSNPHIHMQWKPDDAEVPETKAIECGYNLNLKFGGKQGDDVLPATLNLKSEKLGINLSGSFEVEVEGFRLVEGKPDLGQDSSKVFQVLAVRQLEETLSRPVALVDISNVWWKSEEQTTEVQDGYGIFWWKKTTEAKRPDPWKKPFPFKDKEPDGFTKLRFVKQDDVWVVDSKLQPWQLPDAHRKPSTSHLSQMLDRKAATIVEQAHLDTKGKTPLFQAEVSTSYNPVSGIAVTKVITIEDPMKARDLSLGFFNGKEGNKVRYLFRRQGERSRDPNPEAWKLVQELADHQTVDMKTGEVKNQAKTTE